MLIMNPQQVRAVQYSFSLLAVHRDDVAALFYHRLFELDPKLRGLFVGDLAEQGKKLMAMLSIAVRSLDNMLPLVPVLADLGQRHRTYGVKERDYALVGEALLWILEKQLGAEFTPFVRESWSAAYGALCGTMIAGARACTPAFDAGSQSGGAGAETSSPRASGRSSAPDSRLP
jgi:hemoglobin-like flavoprotein